MTWQNRSIQEKRRREILNIVSKKNRRITGPNLAVLGIRVAAHPEAHAQSLMSLLSVSKPCGCSLYSRCTEPKDVRHESNGKFITYSYPPPFAIITTISRHLQWLQSWECIQAIRAALPTALTAAPSVKGLILKGSIPLETQRLIEMETLLLASSENETQQEASVMAELVEVVCCLAGTVPYCWWCEIRRSHCGLQLAVWEPFPDNSYMKIFWPIK